MLPDKIHFGVIVKGHVAEMHEMPFPEVGPTDIVVKLIANNICTTDYQQWPGRQPGPSRYYRGAPTLRFSAWIPPGAP